MSIKNDLKYPFGDPLAMAFPREKLIALGNVIKLAKERMWLARGGVEEPGDWGKFSHVIEDDDKIMADRSINEIELLLEQIELHINS